tara:strand:+ start:722 stop:1156 length:435 start_codon:yes stop_codon:yes gene_type:complete
MIITCEKCSKKFKIQDNLIPDDGRQLQCGSCNYKWFYKKPENTIKLENEILERSSVDDTSYIGDDNIEQPKINKKNIANKSIIKKKPKIINLFLVLIISIIALIVLLDTFKFQLNNYIPGIDSILNNLYESLKDLSLFFKDLIN